MNKWVRLGSYVVASVCVLILAAAGIYYLITPVHSGRLPGDHFASDLDIQDELSLLDLAFVEYYGEKSVIDDVWDTAHLPAWFGKQVEELSPANQPARWHEAYKRLKAKVRVYQLNPTVKGKVVPDLAGTERLFSLSRGDNRGSLVFVTLDGELHLR